MQTKLQLLPQKLHSLRLYQQKQWTTALYYKLYFQVIIFRNFT